MIVHLQKCSSMIKFRAIVCQCNLKTAEWVKVISKTRNWFCSVRMPKISRNHHATCKKRTLVLNGDRGTGPKMQNSSTLNSTNWITSDLIQREGKATVPRDYKRVKLIWWLILEWNMLRMFYLCFQNKSALSIITVSPPKNLNTGDNTVDVSIRMKQLAWQSTRFVITNLSITGKLMG